MKDVVAYAHVGYAAGDCMGILPITNLWCMNTAEGILQEKSALSPSYWELDEGETVTVRLQQTAAVGREAVQTHISTLLIMSSSDAPSK